MHFYVVKISSPIRVTNSDVSGWKTEYAFWLVFFCVDVCAYAVMSNHTHVVLRINKPKADALSTKEVIRRWHKLYKGMLLAQRYITPAESNTLSEAEMETVKHLAKVYRQRLFDISWFMRLLNEYIARQANKEDGCTAHSSPPFYYHLLISY